MTTRNFRVKNGLSVGDIVIDAANNTLTGLSTSAPSADGDVATKKYVDDQDAAIASDTLTFTNKTFDANGTGNVISNIDIANMTAASIVLESEGIASNDNDTTLPTSAAVLDYVTTALSSLSSNSISQLDTSITVTDSGSNGTITVNADNGAVLSQTSATTTITASGAINLTAGSDVVVPANVGVTFGSGEKIEGDNTDLTVTSGGKINLTAGSDVHVPQNIGIVFDANGSEKIESDDTNLTISSGAQIILAPTTDVKLGNDLGVIFGDAGEKIEGDGTDLTISSSNLLNLSAATDIVIPTNVGLHFTDSAEKIEGDNTDLTVTSGGAINLTAVTDVVVPANVGVTFGTGEKIEGDGTDLTVTSGAKINLTAVSDVHIPVNVGIRLGDGGENIETDNTDLTITSGGKINLATASDVHLANDRGIVFGDAGEKIEGDGSNLIITSSGDCTITATGQTVVTNNLVVSGNLTVSGTETIVDTQNLSVEDAIIALNANVSQSSQMPRFSGLHLHRGTGSDVAEQDIYWVWDDAFADDGTTIHGNAGGAWTALRSTHNEGTETPSSDFNLVDMRANVIHALATSAQYADVAERFEADAPMTAGAVVMVGGNAEITETTSDLSDQVFGVISDQPAYAMNAGAGNSDSHPFVAMTGRTPVRVTGAVTKGQRLVSSSTKGCARAAATGESISPFHVIGRALESSTDAGIKLVNCAVRTNN